MDNNRFIPLSESPNVFYEMNSKKYDILPFQKEICISHSVKQSFQAVNFHRDLIGNERIRFFAEIVGEKLVKNFEYEFKKPATWFQHFKESYFPNFLLKKFPVKYTSEIQKIDFTQYRIFPEMEFPHRDDRRRNYIIQEQIVQKKVNNHGE